MSESLERILSGIDHGLNGNVIPLPEDKIMAIEEEVWDELVSWHTADEAIRLFLLWRSSFRPEIAENQPPPGA